MAVAMAAACAGAIAGSVLIGWIFDVPPLRSVLPGAVEMKFNTALALLAAALALWQASRPRRPWGTPGAWLVQILALTPCVLGGLTLAQYVVGIDVRIDQAIVADTAVAFNLAKGRMSPYTAVALVCLGYSLSAILSARHRTFALWLALTVGLIGALSAIGYLWNASELTTDTVLPPVALNTAVALVLLSAGTLLAMVRPRPGTIAPAPPRQAFSSVEAKILSGFAGALIFLVIAGGLTYRSGVALANATGWVSHSQQVRTALGQIHADVLGMGLAHRNFLITGQRTYRDGFAASLGRVDDELRHLRDLISNNPAQGLHVADLRRRVDTLQDVFAHTMSVYDTAGAAAARTVVAAGAGPAAMSEVSGALAQMERIEDQLLHEREVASTSFRQKMLTSMLGVLALAALIFAALFRNVRAQLQARQIATEQLVQARRAADLARREADAANDAKSRFLAAMSHEIRTPMNGVLGLLELLSLGKLDAEQRSTLGIVQQSGKSLLRIVSDILDFSKIEAGRLELHLQPSSVQEVVQRVGQVFSGAASTKGLVLRTHADPRVAPGHMVDQLRLEQVLSNFVSNAIKFTERGSVELDVNVAAAEEGRQTLRFSVKDTGVGIAAPELDRLFQPFAQADAETASRYGGTGLGLAICRRLAELMGGSAAIESAPGTGTIATLLVSLATAEVAMAPPPACDKGNVALRVLEGRRKAPSVPQAEAEGTLLLVVDDHPTNRLVLKRQLNLIGYAVETAVDGAQAYEVYRSRQFAGVITDCNMPVMSGYELARRIRADEVRHARARVPILACTANAMHSEAAICAEAGMDDCIVKPAQLKALVDRLDQWIPLPANVDATAAAPLVSPTVGGALIDHELLHTLTGGDQQEERSILNEFRRLNSQDADRLREHLFTVADLPQARHFAHRLRGSSAILGARAVTNACEVLEQACQSGDLATARASFATLEHEMEALETYLGQFSNPNE